MVFQNSLLFFFSKAKFAGYKSARKTEEAGRSDDKVCIRMSYGYENVFSSGFAA